MIGSFSKRITRLKAVVAVVMVLVFFVDLFVFSLGGSVRNPGINYLKLAWVIPLPLSVLAFVGFFSMRGEDFAPVRRRMGMNYRVVFQITTRGFNVDAVVRSLSSVLAWASRYLRDFEVWVVTEEDSPLIHTPWLTQTQEWGVPGRVRVIAVPRHYKTLNGSMFKARALNYSAELRRRLGLDKPDVWVYFMDEESVVGEDTVLGIVDFIENMRGLIGQGLIVYSNYWGRNLIASIADSIRAFADVSTYAFQIRHGFVPWMHGSHVLVRADIEAKVGWDFGMTWGEDSLFGLRAQSLGVRISWLRGRLYEQSPFSIRDLMKQRRRWMFHTLDTLVRKDVPLRARLYYAYSLITWLNGLVSFLAMVLSPLAGSAFPISNYLLFLTVPVGASWVSSYVVGLALNTQGKVGKMKMLAYLLVGLTICSLLEGVSAWYALLSWGRRRAIGFEVIRK